MESMLTRIKKGHWWKFHGGIHPPEQKFLSNNKPIRALPLPEMLILPLKQHIGQKGELLVKVGDKVLKGQALTQAQHPMAVPIHAPTSGVICKIEPAITAHPSGLSELCLFLQPDGNDAWRKREICNDHTTLSAQQLINKITNAGIAGMGGAGFPTNVKVNTQNKIKFLIINAVECEPYITADDLLMREHSNEIIDGVNILTQLLSPELILIAVEDNKPEAIKALKQATKAQPNIQVCVIPTKYPSGGEKQLIQILTGLEVPQGKLPSNLGILVQNVATCFAIADAVINDIPLIRRIVTVTGKAVEKPQNVWALLGTPVKHLLTHCHYQPQKVEHLIMGGPMMGFALPSSNIGITKITNCILAPRHDEISAENNEVDCIRCGECAEVCPSQLLPQELQWFAKAKDHAKLQEFDLFDCIECGACAYVCPSQIPLVHYYRIAKAEIRQQQQQDLKAEKAKARFEARKKRLALEKQKREEKHRKAAEARKAAMNSSTDEAKNAKSAVAAALARAKAKKAAQQNISGKNTEKSNSDNEINTTETSSTQAEINSKTDDKKAQVAAAIARAKAKKQKQSSPAQTAQEKPQEKEPKAEASIEAQTKNAENIENSKSTENNKNDNKLDKKAQVAAAIARAKAKKAQKDAKTQADDKITISNSTANNASQTSENKPLAKETIPEKTETTNNEHTKRSEKTLSKAEKIALAVAKAKEKKAARASQEATEQTSDLLKQDPTQDKKARIAAAVAKAKAKKQQTKTENQSQESS